MWIVAGCQAPPTQPTSAPPAPVPNPPPATQAGAPRTPEQIADTRADSAAKLAAAHAKALEALMATKAASPNGVTPVDPSAATPPPVVSAPPGTTPLKSAGDDVFKPVPPPPAGGAAAIGAAVGFAPPPEASAPAGVVMAQPSQPPAPIPAAAVEAPRAQGAANDPLDVQLQKAAKDAPSDLAPQLDAQLYKFVKGDAVPTADALAGLTAEDRDVLTAIMDSLSNFRTNIRRDNNMLIARKIRPLTDMGDRLRSRSDLTINNPAVCRSIRGWGNYEPITPLRLPAGLDNWPGLYYEVENFSSSLDVNNMWKTNMRQDVAIYDERGTLVWQWPNEPVTDICRNRRHDFYFARKVKTPIHLPAGPYILKITLTDQGAGRVAETSVPLTMTPPAAVQPAPQGPPLR